ncbi:MAG: PspC domain-containing protein, partial [Woeseiaceae bacterium]|nr:PspC domain-containing protein [Woeseiaceae bacterium]
DRAVLGGVCAGLAGYFGLNLKVTRLLAIIAFFMAMPFAVVAYLAVVFLVPAESGRRQSMDSYAEADCCWGMKRSKRSARRRARRESREREDVSAEVPSRPSVKDVRRRYESLDRRLADLEKEVTSRRFQLEQEFRKL